MKNFKVLIQNLLHEGMAWVGFFDTREDAEAWRDIQILKPFRNVVDKWFQEIELTDAQIATAMDERLVEFKPDTYYKEYLIPAEATENIYNLTEKRSSEDKKNARKRKGFILRDLAQNILNIATGYFFDQGLTTEQVAGLKSSHPEVFTFLSQNMPLTAKSYIDLMLIEGLITQELIDDINLEYDSYKESFPDVVIF